MKGKGYIYDFIIKLSVGANRPFWARKWSVLISLDLHEGFLKFFHNERGQEVYEDYNNDFSKRTLFGENGPFDQVLPNGSGGSIIRIFLLYFTAGLKCHSLF